MESSLDTVDAAVRGEIEREMMALRTQLAQRPAAEAVTQQVGRIEALLDRAEEKRGGGSLSAGGAFASALLILLREGL